MTVGAALLIYAAILGFLGPLAYRRDGWLTRAPRLGTWVLLASAWSVLTALLLAGLTVALPGTALSSGLSHVMGACILRLRAAYVTPGGAAIAGAGLSLSLAIGGRVAWACAQVIRERRTERRRQRRLVGLCGRHESDLGAVILDEEQPAAYCLPGRAHTVVLTSGTIELLSAPQLAAVLAHEHAHIRARHHRLLAGAALASRALPEMPLLRQLPRQVRRLVEMEADDLAATAHDPETLASAIVAVATAQPRPMPRSTLATALAAADSDTANRITRLLLPASTLSHPRRRLFRAAIAAFALTPLLLAFTPAAVAATEPPVRPAPVVSSPHPVASSDVTVPARPTNGAPGFVDVSRAVGRAAGTIPT
jgi:Zn-dependent protease with chaperone function